MATGDIPNLKFDFGLDLTVAMKWDYEVGMTEKDTELDFEWSLDSSLWNSPTSLMVHLQRTCFRISQSKSTITFEKEVYDIHVHSDQEVLRRSDACKRWLSQAQHDTTRNRGILEDWVIKIMSLQDAIEVSTIQLVSTDLLAAFTTAILPPSSTIDWIARRSSPDLSFVKQLPVTTEFNLVTRREHPCSPLPCLHSRQSWVEMATVSKTELQTERIRLENLAQRLSNAWRQSDTDVRRLRDLDQVLAEYYPQRYSILTRKPNAALTNAPDMSILNRYFQACAESDNFQHPAVFYWICELNRVAGRLLHLAVDGPNSTAKADAFAAYLIAQTQIHIVRNVGLKYALFVMEKNDSNISNRFLCRLLNPDLPPL